MHHSLPIQNNRYLKQTHSQPNLMNGLSFPPFYPHPQVPTQHFNAFPNHNLQAPPHIQASQPFQPQKFHTPGPVNVQRWEDIIPQPGVGHQVLRPHESTVTFRRDSSGKRPSNKELLAKADLILAKSPTKSNLISQGPDSTIKEQPRTSHNSQQPAQTVQTFSSPRPFHFEAFTSPVKNDFDMPMSHPSTLPRTHTEFPPHAFISPQRGEIIHTLPTEFFASPPQQVYHVIHEEPRNSLSQANVLPHHRNIPIRHEFRPEILPYPIPQEINHMASLTQAIPERPVPLLQPAPRPGQVRHAPMESAQFPSSDFSQIRRDFAQLRIDSEQPVEYMTPTPFRIVEDPLRTMEFVPELLLEDEETSQLTPVEEAMSESERDSYIKPKSNKIQRKLIAEPGYESRQKQYDQPQGIGRRFQSGQQSGGTSMKRVPYRKASYSNTGGEMVRVNRDRNGERNIPTLSSVRDTVKSNRKTSSEYIVEKERDTVTSGRRDTRNTNYDQGVRNVEYQEEQKAKPWTYSPKSESVRREESPDSRREREARYMNKVELSVQTKGMQGNDNKGRDRKVMKKVEQVLM